MTNSGSLRRPLHNPTMNDSNETVTLVIQHEVRPASREAYLALGARPVAEGFAYSSDANPERLDARALQIMLTDAFA